ncbi:Hint domain-containing protein [Aquicoccus sp.]|uniref:Hint domain-containing protein n=1 Tax=Aquicoccus sp. TaxID=2055851 RepID=UPI0035651703
MSLMKRRVCAYRHLDAGCSRCGGSGLVEGAHLATQDGQWPLGALEEGARLPVFPGGERLLTAIGHERIWLDPVDCPSVVKPIAVPEGALGNAHAVLLQADTRILFHDEAMIEPLGVAWLTLRAGDMEGFRGIGQVEPPRQARLYRLQFEDAEFVTVEDAFQVLVVPVFITMDKAVGRSGLRRWFGSQEVVHLDQEQADAYLAFLETELGRADAAWPRDRTMFRPGSLAGKERSRKVSG